MSRFGWTVARVGLRFVLRTNAHLSAIRLREDGAPGGPHSRSLRRTGLRLGQTVGDGGCLFAVFVSKREGMVWLGLLVTDPTIPFGDHEAPFSWLRRTWRSGRCTLRFVGPGRCPTFDVDAIGDASVEPGQGGFLLRAIEVGCASGKRSDGGRRLRRRTKSRVAGDVGGEVGSRSES